MGERGLGDAWRRSQLSNELKTSQYKDGSETEGSGRSLLVIHGHEGFIKGFYGSQI